MNSHEITNKVVWLFGYREHLCVANASWGVGLHECDLLMLTASGYGIEVEVKISVADIKRDQTKPHHRHHGNDKIKYFYFAIPQKLNRPEILALIPAHAGVIAVDKRAEIVREAASNKYARAWSERERLELARLGTMRYWARMPKPFQFQEPITLLTGPVEK